jgi:hypothetical protein
LDSTKSPTLRFEQLSADQYERGKKIFDKAKHPGFVGREYMFRCATRGRAIVAILGDQDVGIVLVDHKQTLGALSVVVSARGARVGSALVTEVRPYAKFVKAISEKTAFFERLGYRAVVAAQVGQAGKQTTQLLERDDAFQIDLTTERADTATIVAPSAGATVPERVDVCAFERDTLCDPAKGPAPAIDREAEREWVRRKNKAAVLKWDSMGLENLSPHQLASRDRALAEIAKLTGAYTPVQFEHVNRQTQAEARLALAEEFPENSGLILATMRVNDAAEDDGGEAPPVGDPSLN